MDQDVLVEMKYRSANRVDFGSNTTTLDEKIRAWRERQAERARQVLIEREMAETSRIGISPENARRRIETARKFIEFSVCDMRALLGRGESIDYREVDALADRIAHLSKQIDLYFRLLDKQEQPDSDKADTLCRAFSLTQG